MNHQLWFRMCAVKVWVLGLCLLWEGSVALAADGKLLATPGVTQIEGAGGGGLVPWAGLGGYAENDEIAISLVRSTVKLDDFGLDVAGIALNAYGRVEFSLARQAFSVTDTALDLHQNVIGVKVPVIGDLVYGNLPQASLGVQYKTLTDSAVAQALGASNAETGTDFYVAVSRLHLGGLAGYNALWNITARATKANQTGFLGYGGDIHDGYQLEIEASGAIFFNPHLAIGLEYRQKPNNLSAASEDDWRDIFIAYFPNKSLNVTLGWVQLGDVVGKEEQNGLYFSLTGYIL